MKKKIIDIDSYITKEWVYDCEVSAEEIDDKVVRSVYESIHDLSTVPVHLHLKYKNTPAIHPIERPLTDLQKISAMRGVAGLTLLEGDVKRCAFDTPYKYDMLGEMDRYHSITTSRNYTVVWTLEDSLDFMFSSFFKMKQGDLKKFCKKNKIDYLLYSRNILGIGNGDAGLTFDSLQGCSPTFDMIMSHIESKLSPQYLAMLKTFTRLLESMRNALIHRITEDMKDVKEEIAKPCSYGISDVIYNSNQTFNNEYIMKYKACIIKVRPENLGIGDYAKKVDYQLSVVDPVPDSARTMSGYTVYRFEDDLTTQYKVYPNGEYEVIKGTENV